MKHAHLYLTMFQLEHQMSMYSQTHITVIILRIREEKIHISVTDFLIGK